MPSSPRRSSSAPTMRDVADRAGVSAKTVSNVLNGYAYLRPETKERVLTSVEALGYEMNVSARGLRSGRTHMISLVVPSLRNRYFAELAEAVMDVAEEHGLTTLIESARESHRDGIATVVGRARAGVDGVILVTQAVLRSDPVPQDLGVPVVMLGEGPVLAGLDRVTPRNVEAATVATRFLLDGGRRRVALVGADRQTADGTAALRVQGYAAALEQAGRPVEDGLLVTVPVWHSAGGAEAVDRLWDRHPDVDALFCLNDDLAIGALSALRRKGLDVPEEVAVIGVDDTDEAAYSSPPLTSVNLDREQIARTAVELLVRRIQEQRDGATPGPAVEALVGSRLVVRESTGPVTASEG